jgi:hypothetical protein
MVPFFHAVKKEDNVHVISEIHFGCLLKNQVERTKSKQRNKYLSEKERG